MSEVDDSVSALFSMRSALISIFDYELETVPRIPTRRPKTCQYGFGDPRMTRQHSLFVELCQRLTVRSTHLQALATQQDTLGGKFMFVMNQRRP